jgi:excisionase family DNA binding protein
MSENSNIVISFNEVPMILAQVFEKIVKLEMFLTEGFQAKNASTENKFMNVDETAHFLGLAKPTIYDLVFKKELPNYKNGKRLYFLEKDLSDWILNSRRKTNTELLNEAKAVLSNRKRRG